MTKICIETMSDGSPPAARSAVDDVAGGDVELLDDGLADDLVLRAQRGLAAEVDGAPGRGDDRVRVADRRRQVGRGDDRCGVSWLSAPSSRVGACRSRPS